MCKHKRDLHQAKAAYSHWGISVLWQFGSPAAVGVPQATTTVVFSATKLVPDLTGTSVLAARSPKLRTPPQTTGKIKVSIAGCRLFCLCVCARVNVAAIDAAALCCVSNAACATHWPDAGARLRWVGLRWHGRVSLRRQTR